MPYPLPKTSFLPGNVTFLHPVCEPLEQQFPRRTTIPSDRHSIWQIQSGLVRTLTWDADGNIMTLGFWGPGDVVGQVLSQVDPYIICCLNSVEVALLAHRSQWSMESLLEHIRQTETLLQITKLQQTESRLMQLLMWLSERFGYQTPEGMAADIQMTHQEIAETIGSSRVTVTRIMSALERQGKILRSRKRYVLLKQPAVS